MWPAQHCAAAAPTYPPADFCYYSEITVENNTGSALTNKLVALDVNPSAMISNYYMGANGWDVVLMDSLGNETEVFTQSLSATSTRWWVNVDSLALSSTKMYTMYFGSPDVKRNNGMLFNGNAATNITSTHQSAFNVTDNLRLTVFAETNLTNATTTWLASHHDGTNGYRLGVASSGTAYSVTAQVNNQSLTVPWSGTLVSMAMEFQNPTLTLKFNDVSQGSLNTGLGSIGTNTSTLISGASYSGIIRGVEIDSTINTSPTLILRWGFHALEVAEGAATSSPFTGTIEDESTNGYDGTYTITTDQTNIDTSAGLIRNNFTDPAFALKFPTNNILGPGPGNGILTPGNPGGLPVSGFLSGIADDIGIPVEALWMLMFMLPLCLFVMTMTGLITKSGVFASVSALPIVVIFGVLGRDDTTGAAGQISLWFGFIYGIAILCLWGVFRRYRSG